MQKMGTGMQTILRGLIQAGTYLAYRPKVYCQDKAVMKEDGPVIFICNHMSHKDGALIASVLHQKKPYFLIGKDWYEKKQFQIFLKTYGSVPVDRNGMDTAWYDACRKLIEAGTSILIFPEGRTSKGEMLPFQPGYAVLAEKTGARVVECAHIGAYHLFFGERKRILIGKSYHLQCPDNIRKSLYAKQEAGAARERIHAMKRLLEEKKRGLDRKSAYAVSTIRGKEDAAQAEAAVAREQK